MRLFTHLAGTTVVTASVTVALLITQAGLVTW